RTPAFVTTSQRLRRPRVWSRLLGTADPDTEHFTAVVVAEQDLVVGIHGVHRGTTVWTSRLEDVTVEDHADWFTSSATVDASLLDDGVSLRVDIGDGPSVVFVGLGAPSGRAAKMALTQAILSARA